MLHLIKMASGVRDLAQLRARQSAHGGQVVHRTRNMPKQAAEILDGGSIYWVYAGAAGARQEVEDIQEAQYGDGSKCAVLILRPELVPVEPVRWSPFQGWRYLSPDKVPKDISSDATSEGVAELPERLRRELRELGLI